MSWFDRYKLFRTLKIKPRYETGSPVEQGQAPSAGFIHSQRLGRDIEVFRKQGESATDARARVYSRHTK